MESLVAEIKAEFRSCQAIEVFVLNESGDYQILLYRGRHLLIQPYSGDYCPTRRVCNVFAGAASRMRLRYLSAALVAPGCFYLITINGFQVEESPSYSPTIAMKKEICWLTGSYTYFAIRGFTWLFFLSDALFCNLMFISRSICA
jgi:hypothetical protein